MKKKFSKFLVVISFICLCVYASAFIPMQSITKKTYAEESETTQSTVIFDNVILSSNGYVYSTTDLKNNTLYINSNLTLTNTSITTVTYKYNGVTNNISGGNYTYIEYTGNGERIALTISFKTIYIVQTKINFNSASVASWNNMYSPVHNSSYNNMNIKFNDDIASVESPLYINMNYNGQKFDIVYNGTNFKSNDSEFTLTDNVLPLIAAGPYTIEIFDGSYFTGSSKANYLKYSFNINPDEDSQEKFYVGLSKFYLSITTESGDILSTGTFHNGHDAVTSYEYVNESITISLNNLTYPIKQLFDQLVITKSFNEGSNHYNQQTYYSINDLEDLDNKIVLTEHGDYTVSLQKDNNIIDCYTTKFYIFKDIQQSGEIINGTIYTSSNINRIEDKDISGLVRNRYYISDGNYIFGSHTSTAIIQVVDARASISGIENNAATTDNVTLTVNGAGTIKVETIFNGSQLTPEYRQNDGKITFNSAGTYYVKITDEMGNVVTRSFKINTKMNAATIALIAVGAATLAILSLFIFFTRRKVKVR